MSLLRRFNCFFALFVCATFVPGMAATPDPTAVNPSSVTAKIKLDQLSMIIVPVSINGFGPYDFLLDTGCASTMIDQKLADELGLPRVGERQIMGVLGSTQMSIVRANSLSVAGATVDNLRVSSTDARLSVTKVRGVLGQDFLQHFDVLIDYRHFSVQLASDSGVLAQTLAGEHLPLRMDEANPGRSAPNRLIVSGHIPELGKEEMSLLLDSGANCFTLFQDKLGPLANRNELAHMGNFGIWNSAAAATRTVRFLSLGKKSVDDLTVVTLSHPVNTDTDGLVPTSLFKSIFISSRAGFVILDPSLPKASR